MVVTADIETIQSKLSCDYEPRHTPGLTGPIPLRAAFHIAKHEADTHHRAMPRTADTHTWGTLATAEMPELDALVGAIHGWHERYRLARRDRVNSVLALVQAVMEYRPDRTGFPDLTEVVRCPIESLVKGGGDCEDQAILAAALLWRLGFRVALI